MTLGIFFSSSKSSGSKTSTTPYLKRRKYYFKNGKKYYKIEISSGKRNYLLISLIALLTLSRPGLAPHSAAISSMGTELNTIDVITLKKSPKFFF